MTVIHRKEKILIIESDKVFGDRLAESLKKEGYSVELIYDGKLGLQTLYDSLPHLLIVNEVLGGIDGYSILAKKNVEPLLVKVPVFFISTQSNPIDMRRVPQGAVTKFIFGPHANVEEILKDVNSIFDYGVKAEVKTDSSKKKVLWVEDDKLIETILSKKLINAGFELHHAKDGNEAINMLKEMTPDGIVLDILVPGINGMEILQIVKDDPKLKEIPAMILSNLNKQSDIERAKILGAKKFLVKAATSIDQIVDEVKDLCK